MSRGSSPWVQKLPWLLALAAITALMLARLGHYALWDDEANTAIFAANLWRFGDLLAWDGTNIVAFRDGLELTGIKNRVFPPFQYVWAAPWLGIFGRSALAARLPFALAAMAGFALWAWWLWRSEPRWHVNLLWLFGVVGNVSLFLYSRQSRYYGLTWVLPLVMAYLLFHRERGPRYRALLAVTGITLMASQYLSYAATMVCLGIDYLLFERRRHRDTWSQRLTFLGSQAIFGIALASMFNPIGRKVTPYVPADWWADKLKLWWWNFRDMNACEFMFVPMIAVALVVWVVGRCRDAWLVRGVLALGLYAFVASVLSQQPVGWATVADIRYMAGAIPLCIFVSVRTFAAAIDVVPQRIQLPAKLSALVLGGGVFLTSLPHGWFQRVMKAPTTIEPRSTLVTWVRELASPPRQAYREAAEWLNANAPAGATVAVLPDFALYPLMFHAPQLQFMWQLDPGRRAEYPMLPDPHFRGLSLPDYAVAFGGEVGRIRGLVGQLTAQGQRYEQEVRLDVAGGDRTRPELFWRSFETTQVGNPDFDATYIFKRAR